MLERLQILIRLSGETEYYFFKKVFYFLNFQKNVKNIELWTELDFLSNQFEINWNWVKAHSTDKLNNQVDLIAREAANL